jgi:hypothetical protein
VRQAFGEHTAFFRWEPFEGVAEIYMRLPAAQKLRELFAKLAVGIRAGFWA